MIRDNFQSLSRGKLEFIEHMLDNDELVKCLVSNAPDFLNHPVTEEERAGLVWNNIFPCLYNVDVAESVKSYVTMGFAYDRDEGSAIFKNGTVTFYIFCHKDLVRTDYGVLRYDFILQRIDQIMNNKRSESWIGRMIFDSAEDIAVDSDGNYVGMLVRYVHSGMM